jgi:hypothetical protein
VYTKLEMLKMLDSVCDQVLGDIKVRVNRIEESTAEKEFQTALVELALVRMKVGIWDAMQEADETRFATNGDVTGHSY